MVVTGNNYRSSLYQTNEMFYSGVVKVSSNGHYGTGSLLYDGSAILTAAHIFSKDLSETTVTFELEDRQTYTIDASRVLIHPKYDKQNSNNDVAIVFLNQNASVETTRYDIYRKSDELTQDFTAVGYGNVGLGRLGEDTSSKEFLRLKATNTFETLGEILKGELGSSMQWDPLESSILVADFDDGTTNHYALGALLNLYDKGTGLSEGMIASGDSGGPAFVDAKIAGVASYTSALSSYSLDPDIDSESNSSFGEVGFWQRVSYYQEWIDKSLRANYTDAPTSKDEVVFEVSENSIYTYFLVELLNPSNNREGSYSVDYTTRDGSAVAGEDYIALSGTLNLYSDEEYAVIAVEIINDNIYENNEEFYLDVTNPVGGTLLGGVTTLSASRTILNDDLI